MFMSVFPPHHIQKLYWKDEALETISPILSSVWKLKITVSEQECDFHMVHWKPKHM